MVELELALGWRGNDATVCSVLPGGDKCGVEESFSL